MSNFKPGDIVKYKAVFLQNIGWYTNVPKDGRVEKANGSIVYVFWCEATEATPVNAANIMPTDKPDYTGL
jgi:hypothetical protein